MAAAACCFCGRTVDQVTHLLQGPELLICDICIDACVDTLATKDHGWRERQIDYLLRLRNRRSLADSSLRVGLPIVTVGHPVSCRTTPLAQGRFSAKSRPRCKRTALYS